MICSNCNSEITDKAKFCPVCGQKCAPAPLFCTNCGLELKAGSKFCSVCGTPVGAKETEPETMGYAGNIDSPASASESLVAAMPTAPAQTPAPAENAVISEIPAGIPIPVNSAPAAGGFAVPTPVNDVSNAVTAPVGSAPSMFAGVPAEETAQKVNLAKPTSEPAPADFSDMGFSSASAVAVTPIKKHNGGKIAIIVGSAVIAVLAVLAVVFLLNKGPIMNMLMGNSRYASMIEGSGLKSVSELAGNPAVAQGIRSASASYAASAAYEAYELYGDTEYSAHTVMTHNYDTASQFAAILEQYESAMLDTYGVNSVSVKLDTDITLTDTAKALIFGGYGDSSYTEELERVIDALNSATLTYDITTEKDAAMFGVEMTDGGLIINAQAFMLSDGTIYLCFPFGSDKAIKYVMKDGGLVPDEQAPELELDDEEISRLINEITKIYLKYYEISDIEITGDGDLFVSDANAHGTLITATMNSGLIKDMLAEIGRHIADDTYFSGKIIEYAEECGMELTLDEYREDIIDAFDMDGYSAVVSSVVDKNNNVLGKSYSLKFDASEDLDTWTYTYKEEIFFGYVESSDVLAAEFGYFSSYGSSDDPYTDEFNVSALIRKTSEADGSVSLKFRVDDDSYAANVEYSGVKTEQFLGNDICTGTYVFTITPPADFTEDISSEDAAVLAALSASKFTLTSKTDGGDYVCSFKVEVPQYGSIALNTSVSGSDGKVSVPSGDIIEISDALAEYLSSYNFLYNYGGYSGTELSDADKAAMEELSELFAALKDKVASSDSYFAQYIAEALGESSDKLLTVPAPAADYNDISALMDRIYDDISAISEIYDYPNLSDSLKSGCDDLKSDIYDLYYETDFSMTQEKLDNITAELEAMEKTLSVLREKASKASAAASAQTSNADYSTMSYDELAEAYANIASDYIMAYFSAYEYIEYDAELLKLDEAVEDTYEDVTDSLTRLSESISGGNLSVPMLRDTRTKMKAFEEAVNAFVNAVATAQ